MADEFPFWVTRVCRIKPTCHRYYSSVGVLTYSAFVFILYCVSRSNSRFNFLYISNLHRSISSVTLVNWGFTLEVFAQHKTDKATPLSLDHITSRLLPADVLADIWDKPANSGPITRKPVESTKTVALDDDRNRRKQTIDALP